MQQNNTENLRSKFSPLGLGTLTMGPFQRNFPVEAGALLIVEAVKRGINVLDTADYYKTYPYIKRALELLGSEEKRSLVIISRSYDYTYEGMDKNFEKACREMGISRIPVFMLHEMESEHTIRGHAPALQCLVEKKKAGLINLTGISTHYIRAVAAAADHPDIDCIFAILNRSGLGIMDGTAAEMEEALRIAHDKGKIILIMKALGGGHLFRDAHKSLSYAGDLPFSDCVVVGMQSREELDFNLSAMGLSDEPGQGYDLEIKNEARMLIVEDYCRGCGECVKTCPFGAMGIVAEKAVVDREKCMLCSYCAGACPDFCIKII